MLRGWRACGDDRWGFASLHRPPPNTKCRSLALTEMDILFVLIPLSVVLAFAILGALGWAVWRGQFDGIEAEGERILRED